MITPIKAKAPAGYRVWIKFDDGVEGETDLSDLASRGGFEAWKDREFFEAIEVPDYDAFAWPGDRSLCSDMLYMRLTSMSWEEPSAKDKTPVCSG